MVIELKSKIWDILKHSSSIRQEEKNTSRKFFQEAKKLAAPGLFHVPIFRRNYFSCRCCGSLKNLNPKGVKSF